MAVLCLNADLLPLGLLGSLRPGCPGLEKTENHGQWQLRASAYRVIFPGSPHLIRCSSYWSPAPTGSHQSIPGIFQLICKFWLASVLAWLLSLLPWHQINDFSLPLSPHLLCPAIVIWPRTDSGLQFTSKCQSSNWVSTGTPRSEKQSNFSILSLSVWSLSSTKHHITCDQLFGEYSLILKNIWESCCAKTVNVLRLFLCTFIVLMRSWCLPV